MDGLDKIIFKEKKFSELLSEIYDNQKKKDVQISSLISELKPLVTDIGDATLVVPLIKEYLEMGVKNDEQLIKLASIIQKISQVSNNPGDNNSFNLSEKEKEDLMKTIDDLGKKNLDKK